MTKNKIALYILIVSVVISGITTCLFFFERHILFGLIWLIVATISLIVSCFFAKKEN